MQWRPVRSTSIARVGYDPKLRELGVAFRHGGTYLYSAVAAAVFEAFNEAESKGRFFHAHVLDRYPLRRL